MTVDAKAQTKAEAQNEALLEEVNLATAELIRLLRSSLAPAEVLATAAQSIREVGATLKPHEQPGSGWSTLSIAGYKTPLRWEDADIPNAMPYSPVSGRYNAAAPPIQLWRDGSCVRGEVTFTPTYAGPPDSVHGGIIAAVFDEVLAMANVISGSAGFTGTLSIRYHKLTPLNTPIELYAENLRQDERKQTCRGEMRVNGEITATAEGLFISATKPEESTD